MSKQVTDRVKAVANETVRRMNPDVFGGPLASQETPRRGKWVPMPKELLDKGTLNVPTRVRRLVGKTLCEVFSGEGTATPGKRIRQDQKPLLSKWEKQWFDTISLLDFHGVRGQELRFRLANGAWYKPDVTATQDETNHLHCWEVKGGAKMKGVAKGLLALKVAAATFPEVRWHLVWKENGQWRQQEVLP